MFPKRILQRNTTSTALLCAALALQSAFAYADQASSFCLSMKELVNQANSNFSATDSNPIQPTLTSADSCTMALSHSGAKSVHCSWKFEFRTSAAIEQFEGLNHALMRCFGGQSKAIKDQKVNHPDFYDQNQFKFGDVLATVALKDKSALQSTYVFVGVHGVVQE